MSPDVVAFDLFGTLVHPLGVPSGLGLPDAEIEPFAATWRRHQLEISWLLTAMGRYQDWPVVMGAALDVAATELGIVLTSAQREATLAQGGTPELYDDVLEALDGLGEAGWTLAVFSNAAPAALASITTRTGIASRVGQLISVDDVQAFKPARAAYEYAARRLDRRPGDLWLVSANPFDCAGAKNAGWRVAKLDRRRSFTYPFVDPPDLTIAGLGELAARLDRPPGRR